MVQKEVALRMLAPGEQRLGVLSLAVQYYSKPPWLLNVPRTVFIPPLRRFGVVVSLSPLPLRWTPLEEELFAVIRAGFQPRRKTVRNASESGSGTGDWTQSNWSRLYTQARLNLPSGRKSFVPEDFSRLTKELLKGV
jgi:16S rRNA A1518/A1519 N6-dimethyltransferase RsmA/KsgA/DIM1 with predicted DNA glycosylase/AP lyase activity